LEEAFQVPLYICAPAGSCEAGTFPPASSVATPLLAPSAAMSILRFKAVWVAELTGLFTSDVLLT
jgi:hypothetical protein